MTSSAEALGPVVWFTGRPASGKTTLARAVVARLRQAGAPVLWLDCDDLRPHLTPGAGYDDAGRAAFYGALAHVARRAAEGGVTTIISATAPRRAHRDVLRAAIPDLREVLVAADEATLRARDPKGLYARADAGEITLLPGAGTDYEPPAEPWWVVDTTTEGVDASATRILSGLGLPLRPVSDGSPR